jgi:hypothetical protein
MALTRLPAVHKACLIALIVAVLSSCDPSGNAVKTAPMNVPATAASQGETSRHDLSDDEAAGGHTLRKHVGRSDDDLRERLREETHIAAASTYSDRATAETTVAAALDQNRQKILRWLQRSGGHPNLVLDYDSRDGRPLGRTLRRGENAPQPCAHAIAILRWSGNGRYYVLTSDPECRE